MRWVPKEALAHAHCTPSSIPSTTRTAKYVPGDRLLDETEWRGLGVKQSLGRRPHLSCLPSSHRVALPRGHENSSSTPHTTSTPNPGWVHYLVHAPEPHILLFRREKDYQIKYPEGLNRDDAETAAHRVAMAAAAAGVGGTTSGPMGGLAG